jgi:hypothetical protein
MMISLQCACGSKMSVDPARDGEAVRCRCGIRLKVPVGLFATCNCGERIPVQTNQAGSEVQCPCGEIVRVPSLSALREGVGLEPIRRSAIEKIRASLQSGDLPCGDRCAITKIPTKNLLWFRVHCDETGGELRSVPPWLSLLCFVVPFLGPALAAVLISSALRDGATPSSEKNSRFQHQLDIPLAVVREKHDLVRRMWRSSQAKLLSRIPVYRQLFAEFPYGNFQLLRGTESTNHARLT